MKRAWTGSAKVLAGLVVSAVSALPQAYTISAKPGVVNYVEGSATLNGKAVSLQSNKPVVMSANDVLATGAAAKAEILLTPGVFLRLGEKTELQMISPSLVDTKVELKSGSAMVEVDDLVKDNNLSVLAHNGMVQITKPGLYRVSADPAVAAALQGKAQVTFNGRQVDLNKGREVALDDTLRASKFDTKKADDLYAWSNTRSAYDAASSYQTARNVSVNSFGGGWGDYGYAGAVPSAGWMWNSAFNSWSWLPVNGAFYSPFGYGFYGTGMVPYAPVIYSPVYRGTGGGGGGSTTVAKSVAVPVNPASPPAAAGGKIVPAVNSPAASHAASVQTMRSFSNTGFATASGARVAPGRPGFGGPVGANGGGRVSGPGMAGGGNGGPRATGMPSMSAGVGARGGSGAPAGGGVAHH
jgi:hypothetical protein